MAAAAGLGSMLALWRLRAQAVGAHCFTIVPTVGTWTSYMTSVPRFLLVKWLLLWGVTVGVE